MITKFSQCAVWKNKVSVLAGYKHATIDINEFYFFDLITENVDKQVSKPTECLSQLEAGARVSIHPDVCVVHGEVGENSIPREKSGSSSLFSSISGETL